ncbi:MAG: hypothetical protein H6713_36465 [Myxococcales bacterium]|nr:hypothetical protein [Myxococcales bacterium]
MPWLDPRGLLEGLERGDLIAAVEHQEALDVEQLGALAALLLDHAQPLLDDEVR